MRECRDVFEVKVAEAVDKIEFLEFSSVEDSIEHDVKFLKEHPLVMKDTAVSGWVYHVETGKVRGWMSRFSLVDDVLDYTVDLETVII
jgi:carbonic anhydrase